MIETCSFHLELAAVQPGDRLEAWCQEMIHHQGIVEEMVPRLGVVWIREDGTGERKMLDTTDFDFRSC